MAKNTAAEPKKRKGQWIALITLEVGDELRMPGDAVPEAEHWETRDQMVNLRHIAWDGDGAPPMHHGPEMTGFRQEVHDDMLVQVKASKKERDAAAKPKAPRKTTAKKTAAKRSTKKAVTAPAPKPVAAKRSTAKKTAAPKTAAKKTAARKPAARKTTTKRGA